MSKSRNFRIPTITLAGIALFLAACGSESPESRLNEAGEQVDAVEEDLSSLEARIDETEETLDRLRDRRSKMKDRLRTLEERVAARATDVALFRSVQSALLDEPGLKETAINVLVEDTNVTLVGSVPSAVQRDRALEIARNAPGVGEVRSRLRIDKPDQAT